MYLTSTPKNIKYSYKYFKWNNFENKLDNLNPLISKKIRYKSFRTFNDDFDSRIVFKSDSGKVLKDLTISFWDWMEASRKIASFTILPDSPIMWGHYADNSYGYMLEYENLQLHEVTYSTNPIVYINQERLIDRGVKYCIINNLTKDDILTNPDILRDFYRTDHLILENSARALLTKHINWIYEKEYRCFADIDGDSNNDWVDGNDIRNIKSITFGRNFSINETDISDFIILMEEEINTNKLELYLTKPNYSENKIDRFEVSLNELINHLKKI